MILEHSDTTCFECQCGLNEHRLIFHFYEEDYFNCGKDEPEIFVSIHLDPDRPWWRRCWLAFKYICNIPHGYGHFDCFLLCHTDASRFFELAHRYLTKTQEYWLWLDLKNNKKA